jgi:hypothetical protein
MLYFRILLAFVFLCYALMSALYSIAHTSVAHTKSIPFTAAVLAAVSYFESVYPRISVKGVIAARYDFNIVIGGNDVHFSRYLTRFAACVAYVASCGHAVSAWRAKRENDNADREAKMPAEERVTAHHYDVSAMVNKVGADDWDSRQKETGADTSDHRPPRSCCPSLGLQLSGRIACGFQLASARTGTLTSAYILVVVSYILSSLHFPLLVSLTGL